MTTKTTGGVLVPPDDRRCAASSSSGERCRRWAGKGSAVCEAHAGRVEGGGLSSGEFDALVDEMAHMLTAVDDGEGRTPDRRRCRDRMSSVGRRRFDELVDRVESLGERDAFLAWLCVYTTVGIRRR